MDVFENFDSIESGFFEENDFKEAEDLVSTKKDDNDDICMWIDEAYSKLSEKNESQDLFTRVEKSKQ
ncbi:unnamed protein product [Brachionus calyciflorus]|uniref:Uncharacterized protein n=1 Tax=Brachionus calyciflorus TaxID=104777 RepID=A0A813WMH6_9BILA|nr:unnamed protein product [Brachionus calyciflorus]